MRKKILVITGAGASVELGMPSVKEIDDLFNIWLKGHLEIENQKISFFQYLKDKVDDLYRQNRVGFKDKTNFEEILYTSLLLSSIHSKKHPLNAFVNLDSFPLVKRFEDTPKNIESHDFIFMAQFLVDKLLAEFRKRCINVQTIKPVEFKSMKEFLQQLNKEFDLGIITLNYDNILLQALPTLSTGFLQSGEFDPDKIINSKQWHFCYHLHGSVHFDMKGNKTDMHQIKWNHDLNSVFQQNSVGRNTENTIEEVSTLTSNIVAGYNKTYQIQRFPFSLYYADLFKKIHEAEGFIFIGYGFNDFHLNNVVRESLLRNRKRPVIVVSWSDKKEDCLQYRHDNWSYNLCKTIPVNAHEVSIKGKTIPPLMEELKSDNLMEISNNQNYPLAIWHNGFIEICKYYDLVKNTIN